MKSKCPVCGENTFKEWNRDMLYDGEGIYLSGKHLYNGYYCFHCLSFFLEGGEMVTYRNKFYVKLFERLSPDNSDEDEILYDEENNAWSG